jgi:diguanylate cyclase (GGDEF)-like protein
MASLPSSPSSQAAAAGDQAAVGKWTTANTLAVVLIFVLGLVAFVVRWGDARSRAEADAWAALALIEQQPPAVTVTAPPSLAAAMQSEEAVRVISHCIGAECKVLYARDQGSACTYNATFQPQCVSVRSKANVGFSLWLHFDLWRVAMAAAVDLVIYLVVGGLVLLLGRKALDGAHQGKIAAVTKQAKLGAERDPLTGLLNRVAFEAALKRHNEAAKQASKGTDGCLMYFDLDRFKLINDTHGHIAGDVVLKTVAQRLRYTLGNDVMIGRLGGDEFAVLLVDVGSQAKIEQMGRVLIEQVSKPIQIDTITDYVGLSIGAYMLKRGELSVGDMLHRADLAMYEAKRTGRGRLVFYEESMDEASRGQAQIQADLKKAIEERQMFMVYQPEVDQHDQIRGVEALVRWRHPERGMVPPDQFIPIAEKNGLIVPLGRMIFDLVCADLVSMRRQHMNLPYVSVNVSLREMSAPTFVEDVLATLARHGLSSSDIEFEITESTAMVGQSGKENAALRKLSELGFRLAIDDFGSGYSSIGRLLDLKVDKLKIDRVFVAPIGKPNFDPSLLELMISLARRLEVKCVAEGVETVEQVAWLRQAGCQMMQGYHYAKPMSADQFVNWMALQQGDRDFDHGVWAATETMDLAEA